MLTRLRLLAHHLNKSKALMSSVHNTNVACCTIPPVESNYTPKGSNTSYAPFKTVYVTGNSSERALVCTFDIFGFYPQTKQGADLLAEALDAKVFMPDFFEPAEPFPSAKYPPQSDQDKQDIQAFFGPEGAAYIPKALPKLIDLGRSLRKDGFKQVAAYGFCWGAKVTILAGASDAFDAVSAVHPAMVSPDDGDKLSVPLGLFPSKDEPAEECEKLMKNISTKPFASKNGYKLYSTMFHGWAAARANLDDEENKKQFADLYSTLAGFFTTAWKS